MTRRVIAPAIGLGLAYMALYLTWCDYVRKRMAEADAIEALLRSWP